MIVYVYTGVVIIFLLERSVDECAHTGVRNEGLMYCVEEHDGANLRAVGTNMARQTSMDLTTSLIGHVSFWCVK